MQREECMGPSSLRRLTRHSPPRLLRPRSPLHVARDHLQRRPEVAARVQPSSPGAHSGRPVPSSCRCGRPSPGRAHRPQRGVLCISAPHLGRSPLKPYRSLPLPAAPAGPPPAFPDAKWGASGEGRAQRLLHGAPETRLHISALAVLFTLASPMPPVPGAPFLLSAVSACPCPHRTVSSIRRISACPRWRQGGTSKWNLQREFPAAPPTVHRVF